MPEDQSGQPSRNGGKRLSRRAFNAASVAAGLTAAAGGAQAAQAAERAVQIKTPDGTADAVLVHLADAGPKPGVILYPDAYGLRPIKIEMAKRLAAEGYAVLVVNSFYRLRPAPVWPPGFDFSNPDDRAKLTEQFNALDHAAVTRDAAAFVAFLDAQPEVDKKAKLGAVGYCMGGAMTIRTAAAAPDRFGAAVSFHGGSLTTDDPNSPHKLVEKTNAAYHIGIASDDDAKDPQSKVTMKATLEAANRPHTMEVYPGAKHGWTVPDSKVYDKAQAERAWTAMVATYKSALV